MLAGGMRTSPASPKTHVPLTTATARKQSTARKIWYLLTHAERRSAAVLLGLMLLGMALETLGVGLVIPTIALLTSGDVGRNYPVLQPLLLAIGNPSQRAVAAGCMLALVGLFLVKALFLAFLAWQQTRFAFNVQAQLSQRLFTVYMRQSYPFHLQRNSAQLIRNVIHEVGLFTGRGILPGMMVISESLVLLGLCTLLVIVEPVGALIVVCVLGTAAWGFHRLTTDHIARWGRARQHHEGLRIQHLQQGLGGVKEVKLLGRESEFLDQYRLHNMQSAHATRLHATLQELPHLWLELLAVGGLAIVVLSMIAQARPLEAVVPTLGLFAAAAFRLMPSVNRMLGAVQSLRYGLPVIDLLHRELALDVPAAAGARSPVTPFAETVTLRNVSYVYPGAAQPAVRDISLTIRRGESVGFIGTSGAGKSTLVDTVLGLLTPTSGEVRVDGMDIQANVRNWQNQIGYVPQSVFLTDETLRRNVALGLPDDRIDDAAIARAIGAAQLDEFVKSLPDGLQTQVGERGVRLSGGERQRVGIARALYHDPAVLVLDEATSSLDTATERDVMRAITALHGAKTILIVAHRLSTVEHCDRLYRLEDGSAIAEGVPAEVLSIHSAAASPQYTY